MHAAMLGSLGGMRRKERLSAQEHSAIARHAARACWHPREAQVARKGPGAGLPRPASIEKRQATASRLTLAYNLLKFYRASSRDY
jgi:hypothetical protein